MKSYPQFPVAEEVGEEVWDGEEDEADLEEVNGPERLWRDGEHEPEENPDEWIDRVGEEKRLHEMQALEKPGGATKGISHLTTHNAHDWGKKPYQLGDGVSVKKWKRRSRLVAREFASVEGKRDAIFSPATSGHVLKLLPTIFLQRISEEEDREGEGAFSQILGCLDAKDAFLQVPQEKPFKVVLRGEEFLVERNLLGQRVGAKAWFDFLPIASAKSFSKKTFVELHLRICASTFAHLHLCSSPPLHIYICASTSLLILTSAHLHLCSSSHLQLCSSSHLHTCTSAHLTSSPLALLFFLS